MFNLRQFSCQGPPWTRRLTALKLTGPFYSNRWLHLFLSSQRDLLFSNVLKVLQMSSHLRAQNGKKWRGRIWRTHQTFFWTNSFRLFWMQKKRSRFSFESFASILDKFANLQNIFGCRDSNRTPPQLLTSELIARSACLERILGSYQSHVRRHKQGNFLSTGWKTYLSRTGYHTNVFAHLL